ncbi:MAG: hypothetical protein U0S48_06895 [Solirubrobacteraceae bacterium]
MRALAGPRGRAITSVNTSATFLAVMMIGDGLAGAIGGLLANSTFLSPSRGFDALLKGLIITIVGGLGSLRGTIVAALGTSV